MIRSENITEQQLSAIVPPPDNRCDQELVRWFALHGGVWSGTASELLAAVRTRVDVGNDLWPRSSRALYAHLESHKQMLRSLGVDVWLRQGYPRIVTLRSCLDLKPAITPPSVTSGINPTDDPPANAQLPANRSTANQGLTPRMAARAPLPKFRVPRRCKCPPVPLGNGRVVEAAEILICLLKIG